MQIFAPEARKNLQIFAERARLRGERIYVVDTYAEAARLAHEYGLVSAAGPSTVLDESEAFADKALLLETLDVTVRLGAGATATLPPGTDLVVTAAVTKAAVDDLGLAVGTPAYALVKATEVQLGVD